MAKETLDWPAHRSAVVAWRQERRTGTIDDRKLRQVEVRLPPMIAAQDLWLSPATTSDMEESLREVSALDSSQGDHLRALETLLLRTESVASSKIEAIEADINDYARALHGIRSNEAAMSMAAATSALNALIHSVDDAGDVTVAAILQAHEALMQGDPHEQAYAGRVRDMQNWIGGSDHSPRGALYVPPPAGTVMDYLEDLVAFMNRDDVPVLAQAAIAHAQFESIHPFTDGNGRVGRALINTVLRRRGATRRVVVPLASALVARKDDYFSLLGDYRAGSPEPIIRAFTDATLVAAAESRISASRIAQMADGWRQDLGPIRRTSAADTLFGQLTTHPIFSAEEAEKLLDTSTSSVYAAIDRFVQAGVLRPLTARKRNQIWGVAALLDELDDLGIRIAVRARR